MQRKEILLKLHKYKSRENKDQTTWRRDASSTKHMYRASLISEVAFHMPSLAKNFASFAKRKNGAQKFKYSSQIKYSKFSIIENNNIMNYWAIQQVNT